LLQDAEKYTYGSVDLIPASASSDDYQHMQGDKYLPLSHVTYSGSMIIRPREVKPCNTDHMILQKYAMKTYVADQKHISSATIVPKATIASNGGVSYLSRFPSQESVV
jgi:hypothetical protein